MKKGAEKFIIVTDDKRYCNNLFPNYEVISVQLRNVFYLMKARKVIVSNSTFSYFPIKLQKDNPYVIAPVYWGRYNDKKYGHHQVIFIKIGIG